MIKGLMIHDQLANYYNFLGLSGYKRCHEYHYLAESCEYSRFNAYVVEHHNKLIQQLSIDDPKVIPDSWYRHFRQDVDNNTKKNSVKNGLDIWIEWEKDTKRLYEKFYKQLMELDEIDGACYLKRLIKGATHELKKAEKYQLNMKSVDYGLSYIISTQKTLHCEYKKKLKYLYAKHTRD